MAVRQKTKEQKTKEYVLWFDNLGIDEVPLVGGKSASLGEMTSKTKVPVPYGFATTATAYWHFVDSAGLRDTISKALEKIKDPNDTKVLQSVGKTIRNAMVKAPFPEDLEKEIRASYQKLGDKIGESEPFVAVRSSATAEDLPDASFAGQQETYLNIRGGDDVVKRIKECYASLFTDRVIFYREQKGFEHMSVALSASVQMMVYSKASGVMFTLNVSNGDANVILIEAGYGLGEYIVGGIIVPDEYVVRKSNLKIEKKNIVMKPIMLSRNPNGGTVEQQVPHDIADLPVLTDSEIVTLAKYARDIEKHYKRQMDIEWALDERSNKLFILQARPETVWSAEKVPQAGRETEVSATTSERNMIVQGLPASPGMAAGKAHVIGSVDKIHEFKEGEILVTEMTAPDWVPAMQKSKAIVTDSGGMTCHAAIVSREMGIPCIVGTKSKGRPATVAIKTGMDITVDAKNGVVYEGILAEAIAKPAAEGGGETVIQAETFPVTGTKIYMNLGNPDLAEKHSALPCDGIGLMREEFIWTTFIHEHPLYLIEIGEPEKVVDMLAEGIRKVCQPMNPRPVVLRFSDFKSSEYRDLKGGDKYEPQEPSALLGWRGASRYYDPKYKEAFKLEVKAVRKVREEFGLKNLHIMIPFCRTVEECRKVIDIMAEEGLKRSPDFKVWLMAEIPSNVILADRFNPYIDGYSIGSNDLTMLVLGCDRDNDTVADIFDERDLAVKRAIKKLIDVAHKDGKTVSICGQAPSVYEDFTVFLVKAGIDSISVNPDAVKATKKLVAQVEQRLLLECVTKQGLNAENDLDW